MRLSIWVCGLWLVAGVFSGTTLAEEKPALKVVVVAHRAAHETAPENTLPAIQAAIDLGCDYVELDIRTTRDGHLVVMHDSTVDRTTDGTGKVDQLTLAEIHQLDAGFKRGSQWKGTRVPGFEESLALCSGKTGLYLDHKNADVTKIVPLLKKHSMLNSTVIYSGSQQTLKQYKKLAPEIRIMTGHPDSLAEIKTMMKTLNPEILDGHIIEWTDEQARLARELGAELWLDCLGPADIEAIYDRAVSLRATGIQTDRPSRLIPYLKSHHLR